MTELNGKVRRLAFLSIVVSLVVMAIKFLAWRMTGSVALYSDALESIVNVIASFVAWYTISVSQKPADDTHPFGHHKAEYFSAVLEGVLISVAALLIAHEAWQAFVEPRALDQPWTGMSINVVAAGANAIWAWLLIRTGRMANSPALIADGKHILSDVMTSFGVLAGLTAAVLSGYAILDPIMALIIAINILWQGSRIIRNSINALMDHALPEGQQQLLCKTIAEHSGSALEFHDLKTREAGPVRFAEFHLIVDAEMTVAESHSICDRIEQALKEAMPGLNVTIHVEPEEKRKPDEGFAL
jgi:cation diffusion facilitator family transporter